VYQIVPSDANDQFNATHLSTTEFYLDASGGDRWRCPRRRLLARVVERLFRGI